MSSEPTSCLHWPSLLTGLTLMLAGTAYPPVFAGANGKVDHGLAMLLFWAMSAGFVRGVGFVPRHHIWRWLFSGWACLGAITTAGVSAALRS